MKLSQFSMTLFTLIFMTQTIPLLMVSYTERDDAIRIIGSREVTPRERKEYEED